MNGWKGSEGDAPSMMMVPMVPLPMAVFGVIVAFMFGATLGMMMGRKREMVMARGNWQGGRPWMRHGMKHHHHHGEGSPACCESHSDWPATEAAPLDD